MTTIEKATYGEQTYYVECRQPDEERGLRISIKLTRTAADQELPDKIPDQPCISTECVNGGTHDLLPISADAASKLMADDEALNVFEWCLEHAQVDGDDRAVLLYLAFHATDEGYSPMPYDSDYEDDLKLDAAEAQGAVERLIDAGLVDVDWAAFTYRFPAYETWKSQQ